MSRRRYITLLCTVAFVLSAALISWSVYERVSETEGPKATCHSVMRLTLAGEEEVRLASVALEESRTRAIRHLDLAREYEEWAEIRLGRAGACSDAKQRLEALGDGIKATAERARR